MILKEKIDNLKKKRYSQGFKDGVLSCYLYLQDNDKLPSNLIHLITTLYGNHDLDSKTAFEMMKNDRVKE